MPEAQQDSSDLLRKWKEQLDRTDLYDDDYVASVEERRKLMELALTLGFIDDADADKPLEEAFNASDEKLKRVFGCTRHASAILCRGSVVVHGLPHQLILCTDGFLLIRVEASYWTHDKLVTPMVYEECELYEDVDCLEDQFGMDKEPICISGASFHDVVFVCEDKSQREFWWNSLSKVLIQDRLRRKGKLRRGWQERLIQQREEDPASGDTSFSSFASSAGRRFSSSRRSSLFLQFTEDLMQSLASEVIIPHSE